jgi:sporulation protein YlmC with PRC-barrel domain
MKSIIFKAIMY